MDKHSARAGKRRRLPFWRRAIKWGLILTAAGFLAVLAINLWMVHETESRIYDDLAALPEHPVGMVLGTSKWFRDGSPNLFFKNRMEAAAELFRTGKVRHLLLSGDNRQQAYNEPLEMKKALLALGIPEQALTLDEAGLRTLDSIYRAGEVYQLKTMTIISQRNHLHRALFLADRLDLEAVAYAAEDAPPPYAVRVRDREYLARVKAFLDIYILGTRPKISDRVTPLRPGSSKRIGDGH